MEISVFKLGEQTGEQRGERKGEQKVFIWQYQKRLRRPLTADEQATLIDRLDTLGFDPVADAMFDLHSQALAAWLHNPDVDRFVVAQVRSWGACT